MTTPLIKTGALALGLTVAFAAMVPAQDTPAPPAAGTEAAPAMRGPGPDGQGMPLFGMDGRGPGAGMTPEERAARIAERFAAADTDGNGSLSADEITSGMNAMRALRMGDRVGRQIAMLDSDGDGEVSLEEATAGPSARLFARIDTDGDGMISPAEWDAGMARMRDRAGGPIDRRAEGMGHRQGGDRRMERRPEGRGMQHRQGG